MLIGEIREVKYVSESEKNEMFILMNKYYDNLVLEKFLTDFQNKEWVILLKNNRKINGFSTAKIVELEILGKKVRGVFSGDTIVNQDISWEMEFQKTWAKFVIELSKKNDKNLYWFLLSKGEKTYRFLPLYFKEFFPNYDRNTPPELKEIMDVYATTLYHDNYDSKSGIIYSNGNNDYLKKEIIDLGENRKKNKHVEYFYKINPGHKYGDELVCLAKLSEDNFRDTVKRLIRN